MIPESNDPLIADFINYREMISDMSRMRGRVWIWSIAALVYVLGGLHLKDDATVRWGVPIGGITDGVIVSILLMLTLYFAVAYFWRFFVKCRDFQTGKFVKSLWNLCCSKNEEGKFNRGLLLGQYRLLPADGSEDGEADEYNRRKLFAGDSTGSIVQNAVRSGTGTDFFGMLCEFKASRFVVFIDLFAVPWFFPALLSFTAVVALLYRMFL